MTRTSRYSSAWRVHWRKLKDQWRGTIVFVGQPAEELGTGARAMLRDGLYTRWPKPNYALGFHDKADLEIDHIGVTEGYTSANVDSVDVTVHGIGGHGAYVHRTKDPIVLAAEMINQWQTIASRENNPLDPIVVTVGSIHGGTKHNIIPDEVKMQLTVRTYKADVRERVLAAIERIAKGCATAAGLPPDKMPTVTVERDHFAPAMYNNPELTKRLVAAWKKTLGDPNVEMVDPTMGGEDFSEYSLLPDHSIPAVNFHVGAVDPAKIAESKKPGRGAAADFAFEQVCTRAGTDYSHRDGGDDRSGAGFDEEVVVGNPFFRHPERQSRDPLP